MGLALEEDEVVQGFMSLESTGDAFQVTFAVAGALLRADLHASCFLGGRG